MKKATVFVLFLLGKGSCYASSLSQHSNDDMYFVLLVLAFFALIIGSHFFITNFTRIKLMWLNYLNQYYSMLSGSKDEE